ncbi:MAG: hypothetical protein U0172_13625 [Nitrospiraceae bacterium]
MMSRIRSFLLGPEGFWGLLSLLTYLVAASNRPATSAGNELLETLWLAIPLVGVPLTFFTGYVQAGSRWWWLLRVVLSSLVGVMVASGIAASGVDYHDSRNAGLMTAPFYSLTFGVLVVVPGVLIAAVVIWRRNRKPT